MKKEGNLVSNTLSYQFHITAAMKIDELQTAIYLLLTEICPGFTYRFFEKDLILLKQRQDPSLNPVSLILEPIKPVKKLFTIHSIPLYCFEWKKNSRVFFICTINSSILIYLYQLRLIDYSYKTIGSLIHYTFLFCTQIWIVFVDASYIQRGC